jgi:hypothetical protein
LLSGQNIKSIQSRRILLREGLFRLGRGFHLYLSFHKAGVILVVFKLRLRVIFSNFILFETQNLGYVSIVKRKGIMYPNAQIFWKKTENRMFCLMVNALPWFKFALL